MNRKIPASLAHYDEYSKMSQEQLELAWLGCIFTNPEFSQSIGLSGIDRSMFINTNYFDWGLELLKSGAINKFSDETLIAMMRLGLISKINKFQDDMFFMPAYFRFYNTEIEKRSDTGADASWM